MSRRIALLAAAIATATLALPVHADRFSFMALGDMPYNLPGDYAAFDRLLDQPFGWQTVGADSIVAVEGLDISLRRVAEGVAAAGGTLVITADHGNCETMRDPVTGGPHTAHTTNPVPIVMMGAGNRTLVEGGRLADLAPTLLELMDLPKPPEMNGVSLLGGN